MVANEPPNFLMFVNNPKYCAANYLAYLKNALRSAFDFTEYVSFVTTLAFVFGIAFQMPLAIFFLNKAGLVSVTQLTTSRKYVLLGIVVVAAMATPPDVISQVTLALPLYLLFELGIILSRLSDMSNKN